MIKFILTHSLTHVLFSVSKILTMSWFNPSQQPRLTQPLTHSPSKIRRVKAGELMGWEKDSLIGKAKAVHTSKANQGINSLLPMSSQLQESQAPSHVMVAWEDKFHHSKCPPSLLYPSTLYTELGLEHPFGQLGSVSSQLPKHPQSPHQHGSSKSRTGPSFLPWLTATWLAAQSFQEFGLLSRNWYLNCMFLGV